MTNPKDELKLFTVTVAEHRAVTYRIWAETEDQAREDILSGEFNEEDEVDSEIVSSDVVLVEVADGQ